MNRYTALIAGAAGHVGSMLTKVLDQDDDWQVLTLGRSAGGGNHISANLLRDDLDAKLSKAPKATHIFYCVRAPHDESGKENVEGNLLMLRRLVEATERVSASLSHVHIVEGGKWYGAHLGPYKTPALEDDPRHEGENFYHAQEDWLRARQLHANWTWSASRPSFVCGVIPGQGRNLVSTLGVYAAICRELDVPLDYPGSEQSFHSLTEITEGGLLARAIRFMATSPLAKNQAFNVTNSDTFRWSDVWPSLASFFGVAPGSARPFKMREWSADKEDVWASIVARHKLKKTPLMNIANWLFADFVMGQYYDVASDTRKLRNAGFDEVHDSKREILTILSEYRRLSFLP